MIKDRSYRIAIRSLRYARDYLFNIDTSCLSSDSRRNISELIFDLDSIISFETTELPF